MEVLLVDKDDSFLEQEKIFLEKEGSDLYLHKARSVKEGIKKLETTQIDVVVSGYDLRDDDVLGFLKKIREEMNSDIPFIIFTDESKERLAVKALNLGADRYIHKRMDQRSQYDVLIDAIKQVGKHHRTQKKYERSRQRYEKLYDQTYNAVYLLDPETKEIIEGNKRFYDFLGYEHGELEGQSIYEIIPHDRNNIDDKIQKILEEGTKDFGRRNWIRKDGEIITLDISAKKISEDEKDLLFVIAKDITERKKTKEKLRKNHRRFNAIFNDPKTLLGILNTSGELITVNQTAIDLIDSDKSDIIGEKFWNTPWWTHSRELQKRLKKGISKALEGDYDQFEATHITEKRDKIFVDFHVRPVRDDDGEIISLVVEGRDITEKKEAERALKESERRFRALAESSPFSLFVYRKKFLYVNEASEELTGYSSDKLLDMNFWEVIHPGHRKMVKKRGFERQKGEREPQTYEFKIRRKDGTERWILFTGAQIEYKGAPASIGTAIDITERKDAEKKFRTLFEASPDSICWMNRDGYIKDVNEAFEEKMGYEKESILGKHFREASFLTEKALKNIDEKHKARKEGKDVPPYTIRLRDKKGNIRCSELKVKEIKEDEELQGYIVVSRDVTERKKAENELEEYKEHLEKLVDERTKELEEVNEVLKSFVYSVSHDLKAPLRAMQGFSDALLEDHAESLDEEGKDFARRIAESAQRMDTLIEDLLKHSRLSREEIDFKEVQLESVIDEAIQALQQEIEEKDAEIDIEEPMPSVYAHRSTLQQVIRNLISNALTYVKKEDRPDIKIFTEEKGDRIRLNIKDNGIGIGDEYQKKIFQIFERLHGREMYEGTGVGLAIVKKGMERMNGDVGVESTAGEGSTFWIEIHKPGATI